MSPGKASRAGYGYRHDRDRHDEQVEGSSIIKLYINLCKKQKSCHITQSTVTKGTIHCGLALIFLFFFVSSDPTSLKGIWAVGVGEIQCSTNGVETGDTWRNRQTTGGKRDGPKQWLVVSRFCHALHSSAGLLVCSFYVKEVRGYPIQIILYWNTSRNTCCRKIHYLSLRMNVIKITACIATHKDVAKWDLVFQLLLSVIEYRRGFYAPYDHKPSSTLWERIKLNIDNVIALVRHAVKGRGGGGSWVFKAVRERCL